MTEKKADASRRAFLKKSAMAGLTFAGSGTLLSLVSACGTQGSTTNNSSGPTSSKTLRVAAAQSPWIPGFKALLPQYEKETGISISLDLYPFAGLLTKETNALTAGNGEYDLVHINEGWCATFYDKGLVVPLTEVDSGFSWPNGVITYDNVCRWDSKSHFFSPNGDIYGLPINGNIQLLYYRSDLFKQAGLAAPQTWDDVVHAAKLFTKQDFYGYAIRGADSGYAVTYNFLPILHGYGGSVFKNPPHDWTVTINSPQAQEALDFFLSLRQYGPANAGTIDQAQIISLLASGKLLQATTVSAAYSQMDDKKTSVVPGKIDMTIIPRPANGVHSTTSGIWVMGIPANITKARQQEALKFMNWLVSKQVEMNYAKDGAIPVREDVYQSSLSQQSNFRYMKAVAASTQYIHRGLDYVQSPQILQSTEVHLNSAVVGQLTSKQALKQMAQDIYNIMTEAGYKSSIG